MVTPLNRSVSKERQIDMLKDNLNNSDNFAYGIPERI